MFFRACRHHSAKSAAFDTVCDCNCPPPAPPPVIRQQTMLTGWYLKQKPVGGVRQVVSPTLPFPLSLPLSIPLHPFLTSGREGQIQ